MSFGYLMNNISVAVFGMVLSMTFCDIHWTKKKYLVMGGGMAAILMLQGIICFGSGSDMITYMYPFVTHFPLTVLLCVLSKRYLWPIISVLTAYLCCQLRRWLALLIVAIFSGGSVMFNIAELILTLPLMLILLWLIAPSVRRISHYTASLQWRFGLVPALYYGFDYLTRIYTNLLLEGSMVAVEFMPFVCSAMYLAFVLRTSAEERIRSGLEQTQKILNMQIAQAVREIEALREVQKKTRIYRHDLRHHMQYLSSCIENGRFEQAQAYIREICSEIEKNVVMAFCENEAANLIFSAFAGRMKDCGIPIEIKAGISQDIPVSENDLCVLLSNALENALRACQKLKEDGLCGMIEVVAYEDDGKFYLQIINSCDVDVIFDHGIPVTNNPGHGIGVNSICAIVEKYGGMCDFSVKDDKFILRVSI